MMDEEDENHNYSNSISDPFASYHLTELTSDIKKLGPEELYKDSIQGALTLNKWIQSIEMISPFEGVRLRIALCKMDPEIQERLGENYHGTPWSTLKTKLYTFVPASTFEEALSKLYQMEYTGLEHPTTFYMKLQGYLKTMVSKFPNQRIPPIHSVVGKCLLSNINPNIKRYLQEFLTTGNSQDEFLNQFSKEFNNRPREELFRFAPPHHLNAMHNVPEQRNTMSNPWSPYPNQFRVTHPNQYNRPQAENIIPYNRPHFGNGPPNYYPPNQQPFRSECNATNENETQNSNGRPWMRWPDWICACGERNTRNKGICQKCRQPSPSQPQDCRVCKQCDRRVTITRRFCYYCRTSNHSIPVSNNHFQNNQPF